MKIINYIKILFCFHKYNTVVTSQENLPSFIESYDECGKCGFKKNRRYYWDPAIAESHFHLLEKSSKSCESLLPSYSRGIGVATAGFDDLKPGATITFDLPPRFKDLKQ